MIKTSRGLGRSFVRHLCYRSTIGVAVLTFCAFLPLLSFGDLVPDDMLFNIWPYLYTRGGSSPALLTPTSHETAYSPITASALDSYFFNNRFAVSLNSDYSLSLPNIYPSGTLTNSSMNSTFFLQAVDGSGWYCPVRICPSIQSYASISARLFLYGYNGRGIDTVGTNRNGKISFNVNPSILFSEVLYGTNYLYRQTLINHLSSINSSIQNIDLNVSGLQSTIQQGNDDIIDALIGDYPEIQEELRKGNSRAVDVRTSIKSQLQAWRTQATQQLNDWKSDLKSDLQAWKTSDETGYLNVRQGLANVSADIDSLKHQFMTDDGNGNAINFTTFTTNFVTIPITNSVIQSGADISSNVQDSAKQVVDRINEFWDSFYDIAGAWDGDGLAVRIVHPTDGDNHVLVRDDAVLQALEEGVTFVSPELTHISDYWDQFMASFSPTNSIDWEPWFEKWVPFSEVVTNYYAEFNESAPASEIAADFLDRGFDAERYSALPWFERVEVLLAMIADVRSNSVDVADIQEDMERQVSDFQTLSTNIVSVSGDVVGLFGYVQRFSSSLQSMFGDRAAPLTGDYVLLSAGHWIGDEPLVLRINPTIQNLCRLIMQCIWYLGFLVLLWVVVNWCWQKVVAVLRWLWSMFDV